MSSLADPSTVSRPGERRSSTERGALPHWRLLRLTVLLVIRAAPMQCGLVVIAAVVLAAVPIAGAWCVKALFDVLASAGQRSFSALLVPVGVAFATAIAGAGAVAMRQLASARVVRAVRAQTQDGLFRAVDALPWITEIEHPDFQNELKLAERAAEDTARRLLSSGLMAVTGVLQCAGWCVSVAMIWPPMLALLAVVTIPYFWLGHRTARREARLQTRVVGSVRLRMFFRNLLVDPRAAKESRLFAIGPYLRSRMAALLRAESTLEDAVDRTTARTEMVLSVVGASSLAVATLVVVLTATSRELSAGDLSLFLAAAAGAQTTIALTADGYTGVASTLLVMKHYFNFHARVPAVAPSTSSVSHEPSGEIELRGVWFRYEVEGPWVLRNVNLRIPAGTRLGVAGPNGAGKSTLIKLICQLYRPTRGEILFDGVPAAELDPAAIRRRIAAVFQDFMTYDLTVAENIGVGDIDRLSDRDGLRRVAELVDMHGEIEALPDGYDTLLSKIHIPDDQNIAVHLPSGGQWQRLAIARALLRRDATIAILDEPASGLDAFAQHRLREVIDSVGTGRTVLLISHHLGAMRRMEAIVVVDGGRIAEYGTHDDLVRTGGTYAQLFSLQAADYLA
jgi:ATP-binding cassette, subfamily B, bacterial